MEIVIGEGVFRLTVIVSQVIVIGLLCSIAWMARR